AASCVRRWFMWGPPAVGLKAQGQKWIDVVSEVYNLYRQPGIESALKKFREHAFAEVDRQAMARAPKNEYTLANATYWFEHELRQYPAVELDLDALKAPADRIVLVVGQESRGYPCYEVNVELGKKLGREVIELPGGHVGYVSQGAEFVREFMQALARTGHGPEA